MMAYLFSGIAIVFTFGLVIFIHEAGHFVLCRVLGVKVERFAFGFGPELFGFTRGETRYSVCAFPLGGFVKPAGEEPTETGTAKPDEYFGQPWYGRLAIVYAGPTMNYFLAWLLFTALLLWKGMPVPVTEAKIGQLMKDYPAAKAGMQAGDQVVAVEAEPIETWDEMAKIIHASGEKKLELTVKRGEEQTKVTVTPIKDESGRGLIGIGPDTAFAPVGFFGAIKGGFQQCWYATAETVKTLSSKIVKMEKPELAGPVGIMQMIGKKAHEGADEFVYLIGLISVAVGFFNFLPIPLLDGGHAMVYIYEGISRRKVTAHMMSVANSVGLAFLLGVLLFATYQDISRLRRPPWKQQQEKAAPSAPAEGSPSTPPVEQPAPSK